MTDSTRTQQWARRLLVLSVILALWAAVIALTGGFRVELGPVRLSSRNAARVFLLALVAAALAWRLGYEDGVDRGLRPLRSSLDRLWADLHGQQTTLGRLWAVLAREESLTRLAAVLVWMMAAGVLVSGVLYGSRVAAASDIYGYVSQSAFWSRGTLGIDQSFTASLPWPDALGSFVPLGYRIGDGGVMVPTYAPGLPILMAVARKLSACGPFLINPICGALLVLFTFQLGRGVFGIGTALVGAAMVACSPVVLSMSLVAMADVPAAAFWTGAVAVAVARPGTRRRALAAGVLTGVAILIRPNLVPLALFPWLMTIIRCPTIAAAVRLTPFFAIGALPAALFIGWLNDRLYGSAFASGYGDLEAMFSLNHVPLNLKLYSSWWLESQGPLPFLFLAAFWRRRRAMHREFLVLVGFALAAVLLYLVYLPFDAWWYLRFLVPAIPIAFLLSADVVQWAARGSVLLRTVLLSAFALAAGGHAIRFTDAMDIMDIGIGEQRYVEAELHIAATTPPEAVILAMQHSGSVRYYTGRLTMRWDFLDPAWLDRAVQSLHDRGIPTYALLESWEEDRFRERFSDQRTLRELRLGPTASARDGELKLYPLLAPGAGVARTLVVIPRRYERECLEISPRFFNPRATRRLSQTRLD